MRIKKECLKLFKVADVSLSLKRWLALKGRKSCANVKNAEGSSPLSLFKKNLIGALHPHGNFSIY